MAIATAQRSWALRWGDLGRAALAVAGASLGLLIASAVLPGFDVGHWRNAVAVAVVVLVTGAVLRPVLIWGSVFLGWIGAVLIGLFGQALLIWLVLVAVADLSGRGFLTAFAASWIIAGVSTLVTWTATAGTDEASVSHLFGRARRRPQTVPDPEIPGVVFVQADGVPFPVLEWGVRVGTLPTLSRWIRDGHHRMSEWRAQAPCTTPASQLGILHGTIDGVPAFRWFDRAEQRAFVANQAKDAAEIEARHTTGRGLLADDGVSVSNLFTGDAPIAMATMSAVSRTQEHRRARGAMSTYLARPNGLARSMSRSISEIVRERFQARRARRRDVRPRGPRGWDFCLERAAVNGVMRDLNTSLVGEAILAGRRSVYVDFVDYDAVAHHVGLMQPEALSALEGVDAVLGQLEKLIEVAPRPYHIVVLSDHGQSQGATFADRFGQDLSALVRTLADRSVHGNSGAGDANAEATGSLTSVLSSTSDPDSAVGRSLTRASERMSARTLGETDGASATFEVFGSGNLGLVYLRGEDHRLRLDDLATRFPDLVPGLAGHPGISFVVVDTIDHGPVAFGTDGEHRLATGVIVGDDPLAPFADGTPQLLLRAASQHDAPDIYVNSLVDDLGEVAAFEGLVGSHGGVGGWQDRAMLVAPSEFVVPDEMIVGADQLHRVFVGWLEGLGHRQGLG